MKATLIVAQYHCAYPGELAPSLIDVIDEWVDEDNPAYRDEAVAKIRANTGPGKDYAGWGLVNIDIPDAAILDAACPRCGKMRKVRGRANNPCMDCRRADNFTYGPEHALPDGTWETRGLTQVFVAAPERPEKPKRSYLKHDEHGSVAGYRRHQNHNTEPCDECREAMRHHWRLYKTRERRGDRQPLSPCGTYNAYVRHRRHGEEPCDECAAAHLAYIREYRRKARARNDEREAA